MAGEREVRYGISSRRSAASGRPASHAVLLSGVGPVGLALATRLLNAGYAVIGQDVAPDCLHQFQFAGGTMTGDRLQRGDVAWVIECHERPSVRPDILARLTGQHRGYGRPRLELSGSGRLIESKGDTTVGALILRSDVEHLSTVGLQVALDVTLRGLQLVVRGERALFEAALPLLTVLADRVLYAGSARIQFEDGDALVCDLPDDDRA